MDIHKPEIGYNARIAANDFTVFDLIHLLRRPRKANLIVFSNNKKYFFPVCLCELACPNIDVQELILYSIYICM